MIKIFVTVSLTLSLIAVLLSGCSTAISNIEPSSSEMVAASPTLAVAPSETTTEPSPTPIQTTQPEPTPMPIATIVVREGDTLARDIVPKLMAAFSLSQEDIESALASCPNSKLINDRLSDFRRMEGIILAAEYEVFADDTLEEYVSSCVEQAERRYDTVTKDLALPNDLEPYERLILASIVESECLANEYYYEVAAVFLNRLESGMKLQSCVTSEYVIGFNRPFLLTVDVKMPSPYNTYDVKGLPIGPISVVDDKSLLAASQVSTDTETIFFFYNYVKNDMMFLTEYADFKREAKISRELFESTLDLDSHEIIDKRDYFGQ